MKWSVLFVLLVCSVGASAAPNRLIAKGLFSGKALLEIDGESKLLSKGQQYRGVTLIDANGRFALIRLESGEQRKLELNRSISRQYRKTSRSRVTIYPDSMGMYEVSGKINRQSVRFLVDTGASAVTLSSRLARQLGFDYRKGRQGLAQTANAVVPAWNISLASVSVGDITLRNIDAMVLEGAHPDPVLLGNSFLKHLKFERQGVMMQLQNKY